MSTIIDLASAIATDLLEADGRQVRPSLFRPRDPAADWIMSTLARVTLEPATLTPPPEEVRDLLPETAPVSRSGLAAKIALTGWHAASEMLSYPDPEGEGSPEEHEQVRREALATWQAKGLPAVESAVASAVREVTRALAIR